MRRRIYLMRHGAVLYFDDDGRPCRTDNVALSEEGHAQAEQAGALLATTTFDRVITSELPRTRQTAEAVLSRQVSGQKVPPVEAIAAFNEIQSGRLEDIPNTQLGQALMGAFRPMAEEDTRFLGGESIGELLDRVLPAFDAILADSGWDTLLMVLHGGVNRALLSRVLTGQRLFLGAFEQAPACINVIDVGYSNILRAVNINASDLIHAGTRNTTMEDLLYQYQAGLTQTGSTPS